MQGDARSIGNKAVRRVYAILLAVVLMPSVAMATWYRCAEDGTMRASCCCAAERSRDKAPSPDTSIKSACCCDVIQSASAADGDRMTTRTAPDLPPVLVAIAMPAAPLFVPVHTAHRERPPRYGGPPDPLFVRHCSLLL